jgi:hypothetical protein
MRGHFLRVFERAAEPATAPPFLMNLTHDSSGGYRGKKDSRVAIRIKAWLAVAIRAIQKEQPFAARAIIQR